MKIYENIYETYNEVTYESHALSVQNALYTLLNCMSTS